MDPVCLACVYGFSGKIIFQLHDVFSKINKTLLTNVCMYVKSFSRAMMHTLNKDNIDQLAYKAGNVRVYT